MPSENVDCRQREGKKMFRAHRLWQCRFVNTLVWTIVGSFDRKSSSINRSKSRCMYEPKCNAWEEKRRICRPPALEVDKANNSNVTFEKYRIKEYKHVRYINKMYNNTPCSRFKRSRFKIIKRTSFFPRQETGPIRRLFPTHSDTGNLANWYCDMVVALIGNWKEPWLAWAKLSDLTFVVARILLLDAASKPCHFCSWNEKLLHKQVIVFITSVIEK